MRKTLYFYRRDLKILLLGLFVTLTIGIASAQQNTVNTQRKQVFEKEMNAYIATQIDKEIAEIKQNTDLIENFDEYTEEDIRNMAKENAKDKYIRHNMKDYLNTYFSTPQAMVTTDTFICDNGGFEDDFLYYKGYTATYEKGSLTCTPVDNYGNDIVYTLATLPTPRRFEIVTSGIDDLGLIKTKFGNKALKINNKIGHPNASNNCIWKYTGVDKIVKRFTVTKENRDFTIWYSVALENPSGHGDQQPFLNIKCDLAPDNELCFDASIIKCPQHFDDPCVLDSVDILDWSCHRFKIPEDKIGQIATLEIVVGDCGQGAHFGYAYIDGICEECDSSALGSATLDEEIEYKSCDGLTAKICGTYTPPTICSNGGAWAPVEIAVPGYDISGVVIDTASRSFCFDFPITNFTDEDCLEIYAELTFNNGVFDLPEVLTNSIEICKKLYEKYNISVSVSDCADNNTPDNLSDDYYFVNIDLTNTLGDSWTITKQLTDPYPGESGLQTLGEGTGDAYLEYGPFYKQDGDWWLTIDIGNCHLVELIEAPGYCSGCDKFNDLEIRNMQCVNDGSGNYTWEFDFYVPCDGDGTYEINGTTVSCGTNIHMIEGDISDGGCKEFELKFTSLYPPYNECTNLITVCPPRPCPKEDNCDLEVYVKDVTCLEPDQYGNQAYEVELDISGEGNKHVCVFLGNMSIGYIYPYLTIPFPTDVDLKIALCDDAQCTQNCNYCYKWIHLNKPDCRDPRFGGKKGKGRGYRLESNLDFGNLTIIPNPVISDEILILSNMETTEFEIYNSSGQLIKQGNFTGEEYELSLHIVPGLYFVRYNDGNGNAKFVKMIKL